MSNKLTSYILRAHELTEKEDGQKNNGHKLKPTNLRTWSIECVARGCYPLFLFISFLIAVCAISEIISKKRTKRRRSRRDTQSKLAFSCCEDWFHDIEIAYFSPFKLRDVSCLACREKEKGKKGTDRHEKHESTM